MNKMTGREVYENYIADRENCLGVSAKLLFKYFPL